MNHTPLASLAAALVDRYRLERELGAGGMATVHLAEDVRHRRRVAMKVLRQELASSLGTDRFLREIAIAARLTHPHILPLHDSGEHEGLLWFTMPLMSGDTLRDKMAREGALPLEETLRLAGEVADALDYAHRHDVVHRDIKPENILLHEGHAIVADFGIGKAIVAASEDQPQFTQFGVTVGTPAYMSPEQAAGEDVDGRSDLFALGCVMYEMLTGEVAFSGPTVQATIARRFVHEPPPVCTLRPDVPSEVSALIARLLAKTADERVGTGAAVVSTLRTPVAVAIQAKPAAPAAPPPSAHTERSIVVLPFGNLSTDADNAFFSDGLTEEITTALSRVKALRVIARASAMQYKGTTLSLREVGDALGVRWALTGSVRRAGNALRISAQLADVRTDEAKWAESFSGTMDDVFDVQERVARAIATALDVALSASESAQLGARPIQDVRAFELYLRARDALWGYDPARAAPLIERAITIEGNVPALRAVRAMSLLMRVRVGESHDRSLIDEVEREALALIELSPDSPYGHALLGYVGYEHGDMVRAVRSLRVAMALDPGDAEVRFFHGISLHAVGIRDRLAHEWLAIDPLSPLANMLVGVMQWFTGRPWEGTAALEEGARLAPESFIMQWGLGYHYLLLGRLEDGARKAAWLAERAPQLPYAAQIRSLVASLKGNRKEALALLAPVDLDSLDGHHTFHVAEAYVMAGEVELGMKLLMDGVNKGFYPPEFIARWTPFLEPARGRADFAAAVARARERAAEFAGAMA